MEQDSRNGDATIAPPVRPYRGRFAPTPSGPLHLGSLVAALGSFLDARAHGGAWLLRIEDLDRPRTVPGAIESIQRTLRAHGLDWDEEVVLQAERHPAHALALARLEQAGRLYRCRCRRRMLAGLPRHGAAGPVYPGTCRGKDIPDDERHALRFVVGQEPLLLDDRRLGRSRIAPSSELGDFIVRRSDGLFAYHLATVVDDHDAGVTDIVRGEDLHPATAAQRRLQDALGLRVPRYLHLPLARDAEGRKLSKQNGAEALEDQRVVENLERAAVVLGLPALGTGSVADRLSAWTGAWADAYAPPGEEPAK
ncbi:MAG: tRNA glutamyl-Q(34) synthetase GluQRS [Halothiobacillaceae bacterium]